jgi:predicted deacetylase
VRVQDRRAARARLLGMAGVLSAETSGNALHAFLDPARLSPDAAAQALGGAELRPIEPSLEDVFIALIRAEEARA